MTEIGYITSIHGDNASVVFQRKSGCGDSCASCKSGCTSTALATEIRNTIGANKGDRVKISIEEKTFNRMVLLAYVFPLIMMAIGIGVGTVIFKNEMFSFMLGMLLLGVSYLVLNILNKKSDNNSQQILKMVEVITD